MKNDAAVIDAEPSVSRLSAVLQKLTKKPDADEFFEANIRSLLDPEMDPKDMGFFQRLNTYLYQFTHYTKLIDQDIKSWRTNQILYLLLYLGGLVAVPVWLLVLETAQFGKSGLAETWTLMFLYSLVLLTGIMFSHKTLKKIKLINDSRKKLFEKATDVIHACKQYNVAMFLDKNNGTTPGFDKDLNLVLQLSDVLDTEFPTISKSYVKYLVQNEHFDYQNLAGIIRAHHALYTNRIKTDAEHAQQQRDEYFRFTDENELNSSLVRNIEEEILERHIDQIKSLHKFYSLRLLDMQSKKKKA